MIWKYAEIAENESNNTSPPQNNAPHLADTEEVAAGEPDGDDGHHEEVEHAEDGDDEDIPGHVDMAMLPRRVIMWTYSSTDSNSALSLTSSTVKKRMAKRTGRNMKRMPRA